MYKENLVKYTYANDSLKSPVTLLDNIPGNTTHDGARLLILSDNTICKGGDLVFDKHAELSSPLGAYNVRGNLIYLHAKGNFSIHVFL